MILIFGAIPFTDAMIVRYVDDRMRSRVAGMRLTVSIGISSLAGVAARPGGQGRRFRHAAVGHGADRRLHRADGAGLAARGRSRLSCGYGWQTIEAVAASSSSNASATLPDIA